MADVPQGANIVDEVYFMYRNEPIAVPIQNRTITTLKVDLGFKGKSVRLIGHFREDEGPNPDEMKAARHTPENRTPSVKIGQDGQRQLLWYIVDEETTISPTGK